MLTDENLIVFCQYAIRIGASRGLALRLLREKEVPVNPGRFNSAWSTARAEEDLAERYPGLRKRTGAMGRLFGV